MDITVDDSAVRLKLAYMPTKTRQNVERTIYTLVETLRSHVVKDKLMGQVLNRRTGRLGQSIQQKVESGSDTIVGTVYSAGDVKYAAIHEYGGTIRTRLGTGKSKPKPGGKATIDMPERSFMRSSLEDMRAEIIQKLSIAVGEGIK